MNRSRLPPLFLGLGSIALVTGAGLTMLTLACDYSESSPRMVGPLAGGPVYVCSYGGSALGMLVIAVGAVLLGAWLVTRRDRVRSERTSQLASLREHLAEATADDQERQPEIGALIAATRREAHAPRPPEIE